MGIVASDPWIEKEKVDGPGFGSYCDGNFDPFGSDGHRVWIKGGMALAGRSHRDRGSLPEYAKRGCLGHNDHRDPHPGSPLLFDPSFDPGIFQGLFPARSSYCGRVPLASKIQKRLMETEALGVVG